MLENTLLLSNNSIKINGIDINRNDYISLLNQLYDAFFNTYKDMWSKKQLLEILNQRNALLQNILNGNVSQIDGSTIKFNDSTNSGIDMSNNGAGAINAGYAGKIGSWMIDLAKANRKVNKFGSDSLTTAFKNYMFGGSSNPDTQSWLDRDVVGKDGKRGTNGRIAALSEFLNNINLNDYTDFDPALGNIDQVRANIENLKAKLADGTLNNDDYAAAARLGFDLRNLLSDDVSLGSTTDDTTENTADNKLPEKTADEQLYELANPKANSQDDLNLINSWSNADGLDFASQYDGNWDNIFTSLQFIRERDRYPLNVGPTPGDRANYYANTFYPLFFKEYFLGTDLDIANRFKLSIPKGTVYTPKEVEFSNYGLFITAYLITAISNKKYIVEHPENRGAVASLLNEEVGELLNPVEINGRYNGYWTIPNTFNEKNGTVLCFNPKTKNYKRFAIRNNNAMLSKWINNRHPEFTSASQSLSPNQNLNAAPLDSTNTQLHRLGGILKFQQGGSSIYDNSNVDWSGWYGHLGQLAPKLNVQVSKSNSNSNIDTQKLEKLKRSREAEKLGKTVSDLDEEDADKVREKKREQYWGLTAKGSDLLNINTAMGREGWAAAADLAALIAAQFPVIGTAAAAAFGTVATGLRTYNRYKDDNHLSWGDIGETAADAGMTLMGLIPGVGAASKAASIINTAKKFAKAGGLLFLATNGYKSAEIIGKLLDGLSITVDDAKVLTNEFSGLMGIGISHGGTKARNKVLLKAVDNGMVERVLGTNRKYEYSYKDANGNTLKIVTESEEAAKKLKDAIYSKADNREASIKSALKEFNGGTEVNIGNNIPLRPTGYTARVNKSLSNVGILEIKPNKAGYVLRAYDPNNASIKLNAAERAYWETARSFGKLRPWDAARGWFNDDSSKAILEGLNNRRTTSRSTQSTQNTSHGTGLLASGSLPATSSTTSHTPTTAPTIRSIDNFKPSSDTVDPAKIDVNYVKSRLANLISGGNKLEFKDAFDSSNPEISERIFNRIKLDFPDDNFVKTDGSIGTAKDIDYILFENLNYSNVSRIQEKILGAMFNLRLPNIKDSNKAAIRAIMNLKLGGTLQTLKLQLGNKVNPVGGITNNGNGTSWYNNIFVPSQLFILDLLKANNNDDTLMNKYNTMLSRHHDLYEGAGGASGNFTQNAYTGNKDAVSLYQTDYSALDKDNFNKLTVGNAWTAGRYGYSGNDKRSGTGDSKEEWKSDGLYSGLTDDRRLFGREGDWDENNLTNFNNLLKDINMELYLDPNSNYYMLRRLLQLGLDNSGTLTGVSPENGKKDIWKEINSKAKSLLPATLLLASVVRDNRFNNKLQKTYLAALNPKLDLSYNTFSPVHGDLATKLSYNDAGLKLQSISNRGAANTSNSYLANAASLQADLVRAENKTKGDLYDNQAIEKSMLLAKQELDLNLARDVQVANKNRLALNDNERERANVKLSTASVNNLNWKNFFRANVEIPAEKKEQTRKETLDLVDTQSAIQLVMILYDNERNKALLDYYEVAANNPNGEASARFAYQLRINFINNKLKLDIIKALAKNGNVIYHGDRIFEPSGSYTPPSDFRLPPDVASAKSGSKANWLSLDTMVKELNKTNERFLKQWQKELDNFWKQFSKMKQAKYGN